MYKKILVPLDGSKLAESVLAYANQIAGRLGLEVIFLHVCDRGAELMCQAYVDHVVDTAKGIKTSGAVATGEPSKAILDFAKKTRVDLTLMATHGRSGIGGWATGGIAHKVLAGASNPVLLIHPDSMSKIKSGRWPQNILVPLDGSPLAEAVLPHIESLARQGKWEMNVWLLRVCENPVLLADYPEAIQRLTWEEHMKKANAAAEKVCRVYLGDVEKRLKAAGVSVHSVEAALGDNVADSITEYLSNHPCDLIAMSTHGRSGPSEWPYGRIVDRLTKTTHVPLFLIRPPKPAAR